ncbi:deoxyribonuclease-2-alpha isoform X1 [Alosa sapidissima]|uniref:deoxyribonuclease-2-alpha isoform X1 n=1 Tax=Alosa sapidissima TaxID=34773 RepID=UPI001C0847E4|nr:deoxyribonuclease-2-alpha isoform X1 [Alosa sapidissima]XP_041963501.1 deoxyribonuclease-2-alpha isoform X1 [Alosa sapidissima]
MDPYMLAFALLIIRLPAEGDASQISCYNDKGDTVDWFYLYKLPHHKSRIEGLQYLLLEKGSEGWVDGRGPVNDSTGALARTMGPLYEADEIGYILYNDQAPHTGKPTEGDGESNEDGHTKGVVLFDKERGFWLVHSTPHFPPSKAKGQFSYPSTGVINGQNFLCVSYPLERFQTIGEQLQINQPHVYDCHVPPALASSVPSLVSLCGQGVNVSATDVSSTAANRSVTLTSLGGSQFISFAKGASFKNDLYHAWVAPTLQSNLLVQFWQRSRGILKSDCTLGWTVLDIAQLAPGQRFTYKATHDHSKWAVSPGPDTSSGAAVAAAESGRSGGWVCVGDINRDEAEELRGGGTVCLQDPVVWKAYRTAALQCLSCKGDISECDTALRGAGWQ